MKDEFPEENKDFYVNFDQIAMFSLENALKALHLMICYQNYRGGLSDKD